MEQFEINSILRLLRSSFKPGLVQKTSSIMPNPAASTTNFIASGQRFETLKSLRRQLRRHFNDLSRSTIVLSYTLHQSIFDTLKQILADLVQTYYDANPEIQTQPPPAGFNTKTFRKSNISVDTVFAAAVQRNEILEIIQIVIEIVSKCMIENLSFNESTLKRNHNFIQLQEECNGRAFIPEIIILLGHESTDIHRFCIRFLLLYMSRTHNLHRFMELYIDYGLNSSNLAVQFGSLNALSYLFVRDELKAENLSLLIGALGRLLMKSQLTNRNLFYPTFVAMERLNALMGSKRFYHYLQQSMKEFQNGGNDRIDCNGNLNIVLLYENIQRRAPSPSIFIQNPGSFPQEPKLANDVVVEPMEVATIQPESGMTKAQMLAYLTELEHDDDYGQEEWSTEHDDVQERETGQNEKQTKKENEEEKVAMEYNFGDRELEQELKELEELEELIEREERNVCETTMERQPAMAMTVTSGDQMHDGQDGNMANVDMPPNVEPLRGYFGYSASSSGSSFESVDLQARSSSSPFVLECGSSIDQAGPLHIIAPQEDPVTECSPTTTILNPLADEDDHHHHQQHQQHQQNDHHNHTNAMKNTTTIGKRSSLGTIRTDVQPAAHSPRVVSFAPTPPQVYNGNRTKNSAIHSSDTNQFPSTSNRHNKLSVSKKHDDPKSKLPKQSKQRKASLPSVLSPSKTGKVNKSNTLKKNLSSTPSSGNVTKQNTSIREQSITVEEGEPKMATTIAPGLVGYANLDADTLANLDYIPTLKDYYPYSYYYDPIYHPLAPAIAPIVGHHPTANTAAVVAAATHYGNRHLLRFGIFPRILIYQSLSTITEEQFSAVQGIVRIVRDVPYDHLLLLLPHMDEFLTVFVAQLLLDGASNFKVILWTLDIIELLADRLGHRLHPYLSQIVLLLSRRLGDNRIVIRDSVIKVFHQLMQRYAPQEMLDLLFKHFSTFSSSGISGCTTSSTTINTTAGSLPFTSAAKLREEMANRVTATVSTFPRNQLNLPKLCFDVAILLIDRRSLVRLAALECVATLAQALGPHKLGSLMTAVHSLDTGLTPIDMDRLVAAIQARLARRSLPRTGPDGNVQYVLRVPGTSEQPWFYRRIYDADLEWIAVGPSTPVTNLSVLQTPTMGHIHSFGSNNDNDDSMERKNDTPFSCTEDERFARRNMIASADSEDIPPPVKAAEIVKRSPTVDHSPTRAQYGSRASLNRIDPVSMAGDQASFVRDFTDPIQQQEVDYRSRSLERSKTSQELRSYGLTGQDLFLDRFVRGESIDDSELGDMQYLRKSSVESLEAWRQYFGRFKKQLAEIALNGGAPTRYGSRPGSGAIYYGSPLPPYGLPPAYYYHYYNNGLSNSYHDLSDLQQMNMMNIMKRSGFMASEDVQQSTNHKNEMVDVSESPIKSPPHRRQSMAATAVADQSHSPERRQTRETEKLSSNKQTGNTHQLHVDDDYPLERSISMPAIPGSGGGEGLDQTRSGSKNANDDNMISDEVIQELGMWEEVIQQEKLEPSGQANDSEQTYEINEDADQSSTYISTETENVTEETQKIIGSSVAEPSSVTEMEEEVSPQRITRKQSIIPVVNVQQPSPNLSDSDSNIPLKIENESERRESVLKIPIKQQSIPQDDHKEAEEKVYEEDSEPIAPAEDKEVEEEEKKVNESTSESSTNYRQTSVDKEIKDDENVNDKAPPPPPSTTTKKVSTVNKNGNAAQPARRLSKVPQNLYIKTTPAIPMNANIQHILTNVARTEGPFEYPGEAVKAAVIAMHDNAWTTKVEGMLAIVRLATFHPHYLMRDQHQISLHLVSEIRNLRSTVSRSAIFTIGELFQKLKSQIEPEMDILVQALMYKVGENSIFIREDIDRALQLMIDSMPQTRAALSLITYGSNHRNTYVRRTSAQFLSILVEKMGPMKCLLGPRDIGEHLLPAAARFIQDGSPHTRYFGRRIFAVLMHHPLFDKLLRKHVSPGTYRNISGMLETIKRRGVGDRPADLYSPTVQPKQSDPRRLVVVGGENKPAT